MIKTTIIISFLIMQTSASFFEDFRGAFVSVEHSFEKLISDVVTDVKITIDCTIFAVEHALSLDGLFRNTSEHEKKCNKGTVQPTEVVVTSYTPPKAKQIELPVVHEELKDLSHHIESSIESVDKTINSILGKREAYHQIESVKLSLKNETERLSEVGALLSQELDSISTKVKKEIKKINLGDKPSVQEIMSEVKILHDLEETESNNTEAKEIRHVFNEVLEILHTNTTDGAVSQGQEIRNLIESLEKSSNATFLDIESQYSQWKHDEKKHIDDVKEVVVNQKPEDTELPRSFREVFDRLSDATSGRSAKHSSNGTTNTIQHNSIVAPQIVPTTVASSNKKATASSKDFDVSLFNELFGTKVENHAETVHEAKNLIEESKLAETLMNNIFAHTKHAESVFDNPALFNFGK